MKLSPSWCLLLCVALCACATHAYKILVVFPIPGGSSGILGEGVVRHLAAAGHEVTYICAIPLKKPPPNVRQLDVSENKKFISEEMISIKRIMDKDTSLDVSEAIGTMQQLLNATYINPNVEKMLLDPKERFDLVIATWIFSELLSGFAAIFNAPYVWVSTAEPHWMVTRLVDENLNPAYCAHSMSPSAPPFSFLERLNQLLFQAGGIAIKSYFESTERAVYDSLGKYARLRGFEPPPYDVLKFNASLMLGNSHVSMGQPVSLSQSYKHIGGYHINATPAPLPEDLQKMLDGAKNGLIYFSMGSNLKSKHLPAEVKKDLLKMFGTLKQTVLWKFEEVLPDLPPNVHIISWAPQQSILAHPNCVLFITHGGQLSTTETIHFAKPIIGIPVIADQFVNVARAVKKGFAKKVDLSYDMAAHLKVAVQEILQDPTYVQKVKELSFIYHHRPATPAAELVHWVEHVIKTNGAPHLRSPALDVPFYQKMYLDLAALVAIIVTVLLSLLKRLVSRGKSNPAKKVKKN